MAGTNAVLTKQAVDPAQLGLPNDLSAAGAPIGFSSGTAQQWDYTSVEEILRAVEDRQSALTIDVRPGAPVRGARMILEYLARLPSESWNDRWLLLDAQTSDGSDWRDVVLPDSTHYIKAMLTTELGMLVLLGVVQPSYAWQRGARRIHVYKLLGAFRDPEGAEIVGSRLEHFGKRGTFDRVSHTLAQLLAHTGKAVRQPSAEDLLEMDTALAQLQIHSHNRRSIEHLWRVLTDLGWINHESRAWPVNRIRHPQLTAEEMVDHYGIGAPHREVLVEYLKRRRSELDYGSFRNNAQKLLKNFWLDIVAHHPGLPTFALTREMADGWKERMRTKPNGRARVNYFSELFVVRSFYLDVAQWALEDSFWAPRAAASPVTRSEVAGTKKARRSQVARTQQRTRQLAPVLPRLLARADQDRQDTAHRLAKATAAGHGGSIDVDGEAWTVRHKDTTSPMRIDRGDSTRDLTFEADDAFWTWALVETLRLTGIRCEELQELTHLSLVPYRLPATGEEIPLLHIAPSKTDEERLLVAGPELVDVLAAVIHRVRDGQQDIPLTQRWDRGVHELSDPLPHLFCKKFGPELRPFSSGTLTKMLRRLAQRADIRVNGQQVTFTSHDFRRIFATEALASGLPPHIVQVLLGHKSIATTQVYAAVYPEDVIRHHRTWIGQRRLRRPGEEYREPTAAEWEEFEGHFVKRKVSLGTCGRAYGTNCHHEHACVRCALLRPDPAQGDRFRDIIGNLQDCIVEAEQNNWLGEVEGLKISLAGAEDKLAQIDQQQLSKTVELGFPRPASSRTGLR